MAKRKIEVAITGDARTLEAAFRRSGRAAETFSKKLNRIGTDITSAGRSMTLGLTLPIVGVGVAATRMSLDFESSMAKIVGLVGVGTDEVDIMREQVIELASEFGKTATEAGDALFFITSAGLRGSEAIEVLRESLKASAVGLGDTATIADLATSALNAYGSENLSAVEATDILAAAVREGKLQADELAGSMGRVLPVASAMGVSFDEVGAAFAGLSRTGTDANEAATQLRGILTTILKPSKQAQDVLKELGTSAGALRRQLREEGLLATLGTLKNLFGDNQAAAGRVFGNVRALSAILDLLGKNSDTTAQIFESLADSSGSLDAAFAETEKTSGFKLNKAINTLKNSLIEFGDVIAPVLATVAEYVGKATEAFGKLSPRTRTLVVIGAAVAAALGPVAIALGSLITLIGALITPIGLIVAAIAAVAIAFGVFYARSERFREAVGSIVAEVESRIPMMRAKFEEVLGWLNANVVPTIQSIARNSQRVFAFLQRVWQEHGESIKQLVGPAYEAVLAVLTIVLGNIKSVTEIFLAVLRGDWSAAFEAIKDIVRRVITNLPKIIMAPQQLFAAAAKLLGRKILEGIQAGLRMLGEWIASKLNEVKTAISDFASDVYNDALGVGEKIVDGILAGIAGLYNRLKTKLQETLGSVLRNLDIPGGSPPEHAAMEIVGIPLGNGIIEGFRQTRPKMITEMSKTIRAVLNATARDARSNLAGLTGTLAGMLGTLFGSISPQAKELRELREQLEREEETRRRAELQGAIDQADERRELEEDTARKIAEANQNAADKRRDAEDQLASDLSRARSRADRADAYARYNKTLEEIDRDRADSLTDIEQEKADRLAELDRQRQQAIQDLADFETQVRIRQLERDIANQQQAYETDLANLTERFNRGEITAEEFRDRLNQIIGANTGAELGEAFAGEFGRYLTDIAKQIAELVGVGGGIAGPGVVSPGGAAFEEQMRQWEAKRDELLRTSRAARKAYEDAQVEVKKKDSPEGKKISKAEQNRLNRLKKRWDEAKGRYQAHLKRKPKRMAMGGVLRKAVIAGEAGPEAVIPLSQGRAQRMLADALEDAGRRGAGGPVTINVTVNGNEFSAYEFARKIAPELKRQVALTRTT